MARFGRTHGARRKWGEPSSFDTNRGELRIFWSPEFCMYAAKCPDGGVKLRQDMHLIDHSRWEAGNKIWLVPENALNDLIAVLMDNFKKAPEVEKRPEANNHVMMDNMNETTAAILNMFKTAGYDRSKKIYSMLVNDFHPDKNGPESSHEAAATITIGWREIKKALGW